MYEECSFKQLHIARRVFKPQLPPQLMKAKGVIADVNCTLTQNLQWSCCSAVTSKHNFEHHQSDQCHKQSNKKEEKRGSTKPRPFYMNLTFLTPRDEFFIVTCMKKSTWFPLAKCRGAVEGQILARMNSSWLFKEAMEIYNASGSGRGMRTRLPGMLVMFSFAKGMQN